MTAGTTRRRVTGRRRGGAAGVPVSVLQVAAAAVAAGRWEVCGHRVVERVTTARGVPAAVLGWFEAARERGQVVFRLEDGSLVAVNAALGAAVGDGVPAARP